MKPTIGKRAAQYKSSQGQEKPKTASQHYVEVNTHHNITMKREFMYIEDAKEAININTLETRVRLTRWLISQLKYYPKDKLIDSLIEVAERDRHRLQKEFKISI